MTTIKQIRQSMPLFLLAALTVGLSVLLVSDGHADGGEKVCTVASVKHSGWATRLHQSVKQTIKPGDVLYEGDILDVKSGNFVQLAFDDKNENIVHVQGNSLIQLSKDRGANLELTNGTIYALLDNLGAAKRFQVSTPAAIATVRGTYFKVKALGAESETTVYQGVVRVNGRYPDGRQMRREVSLLAGERASVRRPGAPPETPRRISREEFEEINTVIRGLDGSRNLLDFDALVGAEEASTSSSGGLVSSGRGKNADSQTADGDTGYDDGKVVY
ncbi:MAG: FecR domain-containing protein [Candidatus Omnitrophica bacterium]|nr:FecR domain-containing protein [Candidatus Omnitrophota bacterium]